jgi:hypothetical protein
MELRIRESEGGEMEDLVKMQKIYLAIKAVHVELQRVKKMSRRNPNLILPMTNIVLGSGEDPRSSRSRLLMRLSFLLHQSQSLNILTRLLIINQWQTLMRRSICLLKRA